MYRRVTIAFAITISLLPVALRAEPNDIHPNEVVSVCEVLSNPRANASLTIEGMPWADPDGRYGLTDKHCGGKILLVYFDQSVSPEKLDLDRNFIAVFRNGGLCLCKGRLEYRYVPVFYISSCIPEPTSIPPR